tara:strand:- start:533 stop:1588 length:1056 start_codon:yes stop_codon:yes gene_type:complete
MNSDNRFYQMRTMSKSLHLILFILIGCLSYQNINAQLSKKYFSPPLTYAETGNANPESHYFYISTPRNNNVSFTIKRIGLTNNDITGFVSSSAPKEIFIGNGDSQLFVDSRTTSVVHTNKGFIIESNDVIYISIRVLAVGGAQAGALVSKGSSALVTTFRAGMFTNENPQANYLNFISVLDSENNTVVTFSDLPAGILIKNYTGGLPVSTNLNEGESYILITNFFDNVINRDGLIDTLINVDKPIIVNTGVGNNPLVYPYSNTTPNRETIYVSVYNHETSCANRISNFDIIVNPEPIFDVPTNLSYCNDNDDDDDDDAKGIIQNIDLDSKISEVLGTTQNHNDFIVTFHTL